MVLSRSPADYAAWCNCVDTCQLYVLCTARCASAVLILNCIPLARMDGSIYQCYFYTAQSSPDVGVPARCVQHIHLVSKQCHASLGQSSARAERAVVFIDGSRSSFDYVSRLMRPGDTLQMPSKPRAARLVFRPVLVNGKAIQAIRLCMRAS